MDQSAHHCQFYLYTGYTIERKLLPGHEALHAVDEHVALKLEGSHDTVVRQQEVFG